MAFPANTQSCKFFLWKKFEKLSKKPLKTTLLYSTLLYYKNKKYFGKYFDLKDTICKITLKTNELSITDIRARTRINIVQKMRWKTTLSQAAILWPPLF